MTFDSEEDAEITVQRTDLEPADPKDSRSLWRKFLDGVRQTIGLKPLYLAERWAAAKITQEEVDGQARLLEAKANYETAMAETRKLEIEAEADYLTKTAEAEKKSAEAEQIRSRTNITNQLAVRLLAARDQSPEEALEALNDIRTKIHLVGGVVEFQLEDEESEDDADA